MWQMVLIRSTICKKIIIVVFLMLLVLNTTKLSLAFSVSCNKLKKKICVSTSKWNYILSYVWVFGCRSFGLINCTQITSFKLRHVQSNHIIISFFIFRIISLNLLVIRPKTFLSCHLFYRHIVTSDMG
jgi:hypothetical protein